MMSPLVRCFVERVPEVNGEAFTLGVRSTPHVKPTHRCKVDIYESITRDPCLGGV